MKVGDVHTEIHLAPGGADVDFDGDGLVTEALDRYFVLCRHDVVQNIITVNVSNGGDSQCGNRHDGVRDALGNIRSFADLSHKGACRLALAECHDGHQQCCKYGCAFE